MFTGYVREYLRSLGLWESEYIVDAASGFPLLLNISSVPQVAMTEQTSGNPASVTDLILSDSSVAGLLAHSTPSATRSYLNHLTTLPLETILTEPSRLQTEHTILTNDLTALCQTNHTTFLSLRSASRALSTSLTSLTSSLDAILNECIPSLETASIVFTRDTKSIQEERSKASLVLEHHEKLVDVLELPHLLATCVKNGYYSEALDLANHFEKDLMATLPRTALLDSVHASVVASLQTMLQQLLQQLRSPAKLPALFKTINLLRRMEICSEQQLALAFVLARSFQLDETFLNVSAANDRDKEEDPARWLRKWVEIFREGVYDLITQFNSIFLPSTSSTLPSSDSSDNDILILKGVLATCTRTYINLLLSTLRSILPKIPLGDMASFASLVTQLSYCASSFARVGLDFRIALQPVIEDAVLQIIGESLQNASTNFKKTIDGAGRSRRRLEDWLLDEEALAGMSSAAHRSGTSMPSTTSHTIPARIAAFPPLASLVNDILTTLNGLRLVAMPSIYVRGQQAMHDVLTSCSDSLLDELRSSISSSSSAEDKERIRLLLEVAWSSKDDEESGLFPYLHAALRTGVYVNYSDMPEEKEELFRSWTQTENHWIEWAESCGISVNHPGGADDSQRVGKDE